MDKLLNFLAAVEMENPGYEMLVMPDPSDGDAIVTLRKFFDAEEGNTSFDYGSVIEAAEDFRSYELSSYTGVKNVGGTDIESHHHTVEFVIEV